MERVGSPGQRAEVPQDDGFGPFRILKTPNRVFESQSAPVLSGWTDRSGIRIAGLALACFHGAALACHKTPMGQAELERSPVSKHARAGVKAAQRRDLKFGPIPSLGPEQVAHARKPIDKGEARQYLADV